jgi:hypothetical protein
MRRALAATLVALAAALPAAAPAQTTLTFDDVLTLNVPNGYGGLNWTGFNVLDPSIFPQGGAPNGVVSPAKVAYNSVLSSVYEIWSPTTFTLNGGYFTSSWKEGLDLRIIGYAGATELFNEVFLDLTVTGPTLLTLDYVGVDRVRFLSSGGTGVPGFSNQTSTQFVVDDLTINGPVSSVPEPGTVALLATGLAAVAGAAARRRKQAAA